MKNSEVYKGQTTGLISPFLEKERLDKIKRYIVGNSILDFGCGYGKLISYLHDEDYTGVDLDQRVIESAKVINKSKINAKFYDINEFMEQEEQKFDTIVMAAVIEHTDDPASIIKDMKGVLKEGGRIILTTPTPTANKILKIGSKIKLFSKHAVNEHKPLLTVDDFIDISSSANLTLELYERFEFGLNQIVIYRHEDKYYMMERQ